MNQIVTQLPRYLSRAQAAQHLGVCERKLDLMTKHDGLKKIKLGRNIKFDVRELDAFMAAGGTDRQTSPAPTVVPALLAAA